MHLQRTMDCSAGMLTEGGASLLVALWMQSSTGILQATSPSGPHLTQMAGKGGRGNEGPSYQKCRKPQQQGLALKKPNRQLTRAACDDGDEADQLRNDFMTRGLLVNNAARWSCVEHEQLHGPYRKHFSSPPLSNLKRNVKALTWESFQCDT